MGRIVAHLQVDAGGSGVARVLQDVRELPEARKRAAEHLKVRAVQLQWPRGCVHKRCERQPPPFPRLPSACTALSHNACHTCMCARATHGARDRGVRCAVRSRRRSTCPMHACMRAVRRGAPGEGVVAQVPVDGVVAVLQGLGGMHGKPREDGVAMHAATLRLEVARRRPPLHKLAHKRVRHAQFPRQQCSCTASRRSAAGQHTCVGMHACMRARI
jgi:hypothetical protein